MAEINLSELDAAERERFEGQKLRPGRKKKEAPAGPLVDWSKFSKAFCMPFNLILEGLGSAKMNPAQEEEFTVSWGRVLDKWLPDLTTWKEEVAAAYVTLAIFAPPTIDYIQKRRKASTPPANEQPV